MAKVNESQLVGIITRKCANCATRMTWQVASYAYMVILNKLQGRDYFKDEPVETLISDGS